MINSYGPDGTIQKYAYFMSGRIILTIGFGKHAVGNYILVKMNKALAKGWADIATHF